MDATDLILNKSVINLNLINYARSEEPTATKLDTSMTLEKIREELSGKSIMKFDMKFCNREGTHVIQRSEEAIFYLREILDKNNNLCIKRSDKFDELMPRLIKEK